MGQILNCLHIECDIFAGNTVTACERSYQFALFIKQVDCQTIDFELAEKRWVSYLFLNAIEPSTELI